MPDTLDLPTAQAVHQGADADNALAHPHRPFPDPKTGELKIDPEVVLKAKKFNLALSFFYSSRSNVTTEYGVGRSASVRGQVISSVGGTTVTLMRGDFREFDFTKVGTLGGITTYTATSNQQAITTLSFDGTKFTEYFNDGMQLIYQAQVSGGSPVTHQLVQVKDASGVMQTYTYGSGAALCVRIE